MERSLTSAYVGRLMLVFVALFLCGDEVHSQVNPGLQFQLSQRGFDYAAGVASDLLFDAVQKIQIPDLSGTERNYAVTGMQVTGVTKSSSSVGVTPGRITWTLTNAGISIRGNWRYDYKIWFVRIRDSGSFTGSMSGASISVSVSLGLDATGRPTISSPGCSCSISSVSINLGGSWLSWLYNLIISLFNNRIRNMLQTKICEAATNVINGNANRLLTSFPLQQTVATDYLFDYRFLSAPQIQSGFMDTKHKAAFYYRGDRTEPPIQAFPFPTTTTSSQMLTIWVSDFVLNTIGNAVYRQNILRYTLTKRDIQGSYRNSLDTTCSPGSYCIGTIVPILSTYYPNATVEVEMTATQAPTSTISSNGIQVTFSGNISARVRLPNGSVNNFFTVSVTLNVFGSVTLNGATLRGTVTRIVPTVSNIRSSVGSVPESAISSVIYLLGNMFIIPKLNEKGQQGIQLPVLDFVKFKDVSLEMQNHCLRITTNLEKSP